MPIAVLFDFYGTVATAAAWSSTPEQVLASHGYAMPSSIRSELDRETTEGLDHHEHSASREHYRKWSRARLATLLRECGVRDGDATELLEELWAARKPAELRAYPEARAVLLGLRDGGLRVGLCSNWDWDLEQDVEQLGLSDCFDQIVSSARAGARKPHERIYRFALERLELDAREVLFVGDAPIADVQGPVRMGMQAAYLRRSGARGWPGLGGEDEPVAARPPVAATVPVIEDLTGVPPLVGLGGLLAHR